MSVRFALLILLAIAVWKVISWRRRVAARPPARRVEATRACPDCGAYVLAGNPEPCKRPECPYQGVKSGGFHV